MDFKANTEETGGEKKSQSKLLVLLLILVAGFGYIYFFTDLIKPSEEQKPAEAPAVAVVKKPLPSPDGKQPEKGDEKAAAAPAEAKGEKQQDQAPKAEPAKVAAATPAPAAKPAEKKEPEKKADDLQPAVKKPLPAAGAKPAETKSASQPKPQPVAAKPAPAKEGEKKPADAKKPAEAKPAAAAAQPKKDAPKVVKSEPQAVKDASGKWTVLAGNYVLEDALSADLARIRKAGFEASIVAGGPKKTHMNRLLLAEFTERPAAQAELDKLKRHTSDAFILEAGGMQQVYAGSYMLDSRAASEKERLAAAGFSLTLKRADVSIPSKNLMVGSFGDKKAADEAVKKLRSIGIKASVAR